MHLYSLLKTVHVLAAILFLGTGLGSAWYKFRADRSGDLRVIAWCQREIVLADWLFTVPAAVLLPATAVGLVAVVGYPWSTPWILWGLGGYALAGVCWLPAVWLQLRMRRLADEALQRGEPLPPAFHRAARSWALLGVPSFLAALATLWVMVARPMA
jgi:uncharacterized membrane protein